jgi:AraC-like DNA-binding protein
MSQEATLRDTTIARRRRDWLAARRYIDTAYPEPIEIEDVAREVFTSRRQLQRVFGDHGTTFRHYVCAVRMNKAAALLTATALTVQEIAGLVGYRQAAQFAKAFRRHQGASPLEYRRRRGGLPQLDDERRDIVADVDVAV